MGPSRAETLQKELRIYTFGDLMMYLPFRYEDKTKFTLIKDAQDTGENVQIIGQLVSLEKIKGKGNQYRLTGLFRDASGFMELTWFQGASWIAKSLKEGKTYIIYGKIAFYSGKKTMSHPEMDEASTEDMQSKSTLEPVYPSTDKLTRQGLDSKGMRKIVKELLDKIRPADLPDNLPTYLVEKLRLCSRYESIKWIHFPKNETEKQAAINRIKFEDFFFLQIRMLQSKAVRQTKLLGATFESIGNHFLNFYNTKLKFELTNAQKRVLKKIRADLGKGIQMNRLLQGDVGSGKTIVALMSMLMAIDNGYQAAMMAPTEILAQQHFLSISEYLEGMDLQVAFLSGSIKGKKRAKILDQLKEGEIDILIGTHALIEDWVQFEKLGIAIIDEQHRFGVKQRSKLWQKNEDVPPHILVMTATPIPRTLAMTVYGDLDVSVIDELPPGRKEVKTIHRSEAHRSKIISFMHLEISKGRQIYIVYPLIEESATLDLQNLNEGYERLLQYFPLPDFQISIVHGRMKAAEKDAEMQRFVQGKTQIMVATTVIEVGVNVPNASVMVIENTERFGLSQLHQLRGRVGRGADQSYCILMTSYKLSKEAKERIQTMVRTNNGFEIAEADMKLRGPGNIEGLQQSGIMDFKLLSLTQDGDIIKMARHFAELIITDDPLLEKPVHSSLFKHLYSLRKRHKDWGRIS